MTTNHFTHLVASVFGLVAFSTTRCLAHDNDAAAALPTTSSKSTVATAAGPSVAPASWADIKDCTYDTRAQFFPGLKRLEARVDSQIGELTAKRAAMTGTANTKDWDFTMKEMVEARVYLKSTGEELGKATPETWDQQKDKVGQAWVRTQDAYDKVKSSTTS